MSEITTDPQTKQFLPGNIWRYKPGQSGKPARYNYKSMRKHVIRYVTERSEAALRCTWSGLAVYLGMSRGGLDAYRRGEVGKDKSAVQAMLEYYESHMESELEEQLTNKDRYTQGVPLALRAIDRDKWGDDKKIEVDIRQRIEIAIDPNSQLAQRLAKAGAVTITQLPESPAISKG